MSDIVRWLTIGDLRSDGAADQVVEVVRRNPRLLPDVVVALKSPRAATRGHAADALEKIGREHPQDLARFLAVFLGALRADEVAMVRWHMAMLLGHLSTLPTLTPRLIPPLMRATCDPSAFCQSWAVTSLCLFGRQNSAWTRRIADAISPLVRSSSPALRLRARRAMTLLTNPTAPFPRGWVKAGALKHLEEPA